MLETGRKPGSYVLQLELPDPASLKIGRLGRFHFPQGQYSYVGSAFGPGGLRARLKHHAGCSARPHWHIDYLRRVASLQAVWYSHDTRHHEHHWAAAVEQLVQTSVPVAGFGASDCACTTHLFYLADQPAISKITKCLQSISTHLRYLDLA